MTTEDRLEILSTDLLDEQREIVLELKQIAKLMLREFGWHYLLDLAWIISHLDLDRLETAMDAGAGLGVMQWYLATKGIDVLSVDRMDRSHLPVHFRKRFKLQGLRPQDLAPGSATFSSVLSSPGSFSKKIKRVGHDQLSQLRRTAIDPSFGTVTFYHQDLQHMPELPDNIFDTIVAVSALEHNPPETLPAVVDELMRVLKPGGKLVATLSTMGDEDGYHEPSAGWTYSEASMKRIFGLDASVTTNYGEYARLFEQLRNSEELQQGLARFYYRSGDNGMPWGVWDPQYVPIGVCKVKPAQAPAQEE
jgi:ubiquinone/menaquinone biosynthesis C-methylase UbiE